MKDDEFKSLVKNSKESQKIIVKTYKDEINTYDVTSTYYKNIKKLKFDLIEMSFISFNNRVIKKVVLNINRGDRTLLLEIEDGFQ